MRPVGSGIRAFLLVATPLAFLGGTQVTLLSEHTQTYWAWTIALPISAIFIGASFCAPSVLFARGLQQREWIRVRAVVSDGPLVTVGLLVATLRHLRGRARSGRPARVRDRPLRPRTRPFGTSPLDADPPDVLGTPE